ncbi:WD40 repeat-like protein, partial [Lentinula aff. detonsa]
MSPRFFPYSHLEFRSGIPVIAVSGFHIQLIHASTGAVLFSTLNSPPYIQESLKKSGPIRCAVLDNSNTHLVTLADDKKLKVWKLDGLELLHERELPKRPTSATCTLDGQTIVVADKFGDVFSYPLHPPPGSESQISTSAPLPQEDSTTPGEEISVDATADVTLPAVKTSSNKRKSKKQKLHENPPAPRSSLASHVPTSDGTLVLGHTSLLTCFLLTPDNKYIVTADRDEHIRISWYPQGFCIESFCLGHTQFVSAVHIPSDRPGTLISGGGDAELKIWDWRSGKHEMDIPILDSVKPYIKVKVKSYIRTASTNSTEEQADRSREGTEDQESASPASEEQAVLAVQKIRTLSDYILFTVTGGSALFSVAFLNGTSTAPSVHAVNFGKPVLNFTIASDKRIWVNIDLNWSENGDDYGDDSPAGKAIRIVNLAADGQLSDVSLTSTPPILDALQEKCLIEASAEDLAALNLYSSLQSLPKNTGEYDGDDDDLGNATPRATGIPKNIRTNTRKKSQGPGGGKKEQGKLKSQKAVAEKTKKHGNQSVHRDVEDVVPHEENASESKLLKSEGPATEADSEDIRMLDS